MTEFHIEIPGMAGILENPKIQMNSTWHSRNIKVKDSSGCKVLVIHGFDQRAGVECVVVGLAFICKFKRVTLLISHWPSSPL